MTVDLAIDLADLKFLVMLACVLLAGALATVAVVSLPDRLEGVAGPFTWSRRLRR